MLSYILLFNPGGSNMYCALDFYVSEARYENSVIGSLKMMLDIMTPFADCLRSMPLKYVENK